MDVSFGGLFSVVVLTFFVHFCVGLVVFTISMCALAQRKNIQTKKIYLLFSLKM